MSIQPPDQTRGEDGRNDQPPLCPDVSEPSPQAQPASNKQTKWYKNFCEKWHHEINALGLIAVVIYCYYTYKEWKTFDSERQTMDAEFKASQDSSVAQIKAMRDQLEEMQKARQLDERAWLGIYHFEVVSNIPGHPTGISFEPDIRNTGKTPALNAIISQSFSHDKKSIPEFGQSAPTNSPYIGFFGAGEEMRGSGSSVGNAFDNFDIQKQSPFYLYGTVWYDDIFGKHHWTQYRVQVVQGITNLWFLDIGSSNSCDNAQETQSK